MATKAVKRRATVRVSRKRIDKDTVGILVTPVVPVKTKKPKRKTR